MFAHDDDHKDDSEAEVSDAALVDALGDDSYEEEDDLEAEASVADPFGREEE